MPTKTNSKPRRTKRACAMRGKKLKLTGDKGAAARLARYCPPPGHRKANAASGPRGDVPRKKKTRGLRPIVRYYLYDYHRPHEFLGVLREPYDGTKDGAADAAEALQRRATAEVHGHSHSGSILVAFDENFAPRWVISPNRTVFTCARSSDAAAPLRWIEQYGGRKANHAERRGRAVYHVYVQGPGWWDGWDVNRGGLAAASREAAHAVRGRSEVVTATVSRKSLDAHDGEPLVGYTNRNADGGVGRVRKLPAP